jgi:hypothetical protein
LSEVTVQSLSGQFPEQLVQELTVWHHQKNEYDALSEDEQEKAAKSLIGKEVVMLGSWPRQFGVATGVISCIDSTTLKKRWLVQYKTRYGGENQVEPHLFVVRPENWSEDGVSL